jgi:ATP-dependent helicase HrpB
MWNERGRRVDEARRTLYRQLILEEAVRPAQPSEEASRILFREAWAKGLGVFRDGDHVAALQARIALLAAAYPEAGFEPVGEARIAPAAALCCSGKTSLAGLAEASLTDALAGSLTPQQRELLRKEVPERIGLRGSRKVAVHYEPGRPPWIESALQDFFEMHKTPAVCSGRIPLTVRLLAPNRRPVQVTQDLPGFWKLHYPALRRQLMRRYPKHAWPEAGDG